METISLKVTGMSCAHCERAVMQALTDRGAESVIASAAENQVTIEFDSSKVSLEELKLEIEDCGYTL